MSIPFPETKQTVSTIYFDYISRYRGVFEHKLKILPAPCSEIPFHRFLPSIQN
nr:MAG TPA: hypothetical protein [Caudoviricetes sp.]